jgi:hypothetical protein
VDDVKAGAGHDRAAVMAGEGDLRQSDADLSSLERRWSQAEHALYPMIFAQPEAYEASVRLVRRIADLLRGASAAEDLAKAWRGWRSLVQSAAHDTRTSLDDLDASLIGGAGFCLRRRQMQTEFRRVAQENRLQEAKRAGDRWAVVDETRQLLPGETPSPCYERVEVHTPTGAALCAAVDVDPDTDLPAYQLWVVPPDAGGNRAPNRPAENVRTFSEPEAWVEAIRALRQHHDEMAATSQKRRV